MQIPFIKRPTVESILSGFTATLAKLEAMVDASMAETAQADDQIRAIRAENRARATERMRARNAANKIREIVGE